MKTIGLTGGIASGKSTVAHILKQHGLPVVSSDELAHHALERGTPAYNAVLDKFGNGILNQDDGQINRRELGRIVFNDAEAKASLEQILHPVVITEVKKLIHYYQSIGIKILIIEVPLLFEVGIGGLFDAVWVVSCSPEIQLQRVITRDLLTADEAEQRIGAQLSLADKEGKADLIIYNNKDMAVLTEQVLQAIKTME